MQTVLSDLRYGIRRLLQSPGFAVIAILALGLGIGANSAIFSLVDHVLIRALPYADPDRLVIVWEDASFISFPHNTPAPGNFVDWKKQNQVFTDMAAARDMAVSLTGDGAPEMVLGGQVTANALDVLGVRPMLGRMFTDEEDRSGKNVVLLSYGLWQSRYGRDPGIIGRNILMDGAKMTVIGVLHPGFVLPERKTQFLLPAHFTPQMWSNRHSHFLTVVARLKPGIALSRAQSDMTVIARRLADQYPDTNKQLGAVVVPIKEQIVGNTGTALLVLLAAAGCVLLIACANVANLLLAKAAAREREMAIRTALGAGRGRLIRQMVTESLLLSVLGGALGLLLASLIMLVLLAAAGCVLLIACANVANLLLAKATAREREMAIRTALGAGRGRLIRQMVTESVLLAVLGGALGLLLASFSMQVLVALIPTGLPGVNTLSVDGRLLVFTVGIALLTGVIFGLVPALHGTHLAVGEKLKEGGRSGVGGASRRFRDALVIAEVALALILLVSAGLLLQTLRNLRSIDAGFNPAKILTLSTRLPFPKYADAIKRMAYFDEVLARVRAIPGVQGAAFTSNLPFTARGNTNGFRIEGHPFPVGANPDALYREATNDYLQIMHARLLEGRFFGNDDRANSLPVVIINETFKKQYWPNESALGKHIETSGRDDAPWQTIVGVVADVRERGLEADLKPGVYLPVQQVPKGWNVPKQLAIRTAMDPLAIAQSARAAVWAVDRDQPISDLRTMDDIVDLEVADHRQQTTLLGSFAVLALVLASLGIYGVLSYAVAQRTREIGVRMALGAGTGDVTRMVVGQGLGLAALGMAIGAAAALALTRSMTKLLVGVQPADPAIYAGVALLLMTVALLACYVPAARASRVDPMVALRDE